MFVHCHATASMACFSIRHRTTSGWRMYAAECARASHSGEIALSGSRRLRSTLAVVPVLFAHTVVTVAKNRTSTTPRTTASVKRTGTAASVARSRATSGYLSFHPTAQCVVHALRGLACRTRPSRARCHKNVIFFQWVRNLGTWRKPDACGKPGRCERTYVVIRRKHSR